MNIARSLSVYLLLVVVFAASASFAAADSVVYILANPNFPETAVVDTLEDLGFTVDKVDNQNVDTVDFSKYEFMVINDDTFSNEDDIPVNAVPALILNTKHITDWDWSKKISQRSSGTPLTAYINDPEHFITNTVSERIPQVYTTSSPPLFLLHRFYRSLDLDVVVSTKNTTLDSLNAVIATAMPGTKLRNGVKSQVKSVFFGIAEADEWTAASEELFKRSALWLVTDTVPPSVANATVSDRTNNSATLSWQTDKPANYTLSYGTDLTFGNGVVAPVLGVNHSVLVTGLQEKTTYHWNVYSCNADMFCGYSDNFTFMTLDSTAPKLVSSATSSITNASVVVDVETNEDSSVTVYYGTIVADQSTVPSVFSTTSLFSLTDLTERTTYEYFVEMCDASGNCRNSTIFSFTTLDLTAPYLAAAEVEDLTNQTVTIVVNTTEASFSRVYYGAGTLGQTTAPSSEATQATFPLTGLQEKTMYSYLVELCDAAGNCRNSTTFDFTTLDLTAPYLASANVTGVTNTSVTIETTTTDDASVTLAYGTESGNPTFSMGPALGIAHSFTLENLTDKTTYYYVAEMCDTDNNCRDSAEFSFTTVDITPPKAPANVYVDVLTPSNTVRLNWDAPTDDVTEYDVYVSDDPTGFNFSTVYDTTANNHYTDDDLAHERYYVVRAVDAAGNQESNTYVVGKYDMDLAPGYNLVSLPLVPISSSIDEVVPQDSSYNPIADVKRFNTTTQSLETASFMGSDWDGTVFDTMDYGFGYFFNADHAVTFTFVGTPAEPIVVPLIEGMNLVALTMSDAKEVNATVSAADANEVGKRNADGTYALATFDTGRWHNIFVAIRGTGYWVHSNKNTTLSLS